MGHLAYGYRLNHRGQIEHRRFDIDDLLYGEAARNGWKDSPDKVPGGPAAIAAEERKKEAAAKTTGREPRITGPMHGDYEPKKRGNKGPRNEKGQFVKQ